MKTIKQFFQRITLRQVLAIVLAGILVFASAACSRTQAASPIASPESSPRDVGRPQPGQGMYPSTDVQEGQDTSKADAKADKLIREARERNQKVKTPGGLVDELTPDKSIPQQAKEAGESAKRAAENVGKSTKQAAQNAAESTQQGLKNVKEGAEELVDQATDVVK